jgi:acetylornithine/succinyldiaminopimelate/putrescine aminotransferase
VFLCNSGTEANEAAIKLARRHRRGGEIVVLEGAFHGRTMGSLSATPQPDKQEPFAPLVPGFRVVPRDDPGALEAAVGEQTAAVLLEPVQGETGVWPISEPMLLAAREACDRAGALLVFDEIQCGMGRTGTLWAFELTPVRPDVFTTAKALANGLPVGACVAGSRAADVLQPGDHGATFGGGPLVAAAALATLDVIDDDRLLSRVRVLGDRFWAGLEALRGAGRLADVRGRGLMLAGDLPEPRAPDVVRAGLDAGIVLNATGPSTLRFLPPLVVSEAEIDRVLAFLREAL